MMRLLNHAALTIAITGALCAPVAAQAQNNVNPFLPMTTKPPGPLDPGPSDPGNPFLVPRNRAGVITPPPMASQMPVIRPQTTSRMPVITPQGLPPAAPSMAPK